MRVLIYRYNSIYEPAIITALKKRNANIDEITEEMSNKNITPKQTLALVANALQHNTYDFVFGINFNPVLAEVCNLFKLPYVCWIVDSPILELYSDAIMKPWNRIFLFDYALYDEFAPKNPACIFYLPLASDIEKLTPVSEAITPDDRKRFTTDISFVGSLYSEKCPYNTLSLPSMLKGYCDGLIEAQLSVYGYNFLRDAFPDDLVSTFKHCADDGFYQFPEKAEHNDKAVITEQYIGTKVTEQERIRLLYALSERFSVDIYTGSDTSSLPHIHNKGFANTHTEMPKIFRLSKINLNMTAKSIHTGLPLRIWDVLACGGFLMTNYQSELPEYFEIGKDLETYSSKEELLEKCEYYLSHEKERTEIAENGHKKVLSLHSLDMRLEQLLTRI